jgi:hypothetical protein
MSSLGAIEPRSRSTAQLARTSKTFRSVDRDLHPSFNMAMPASKPIWDEVALPSFEHLARTVTVDADNPHMLSWS